MSRLAWREQVEALRRMLSDAEDRVRGGDAEGTDLEELKSGLDDLRLRAWGLLTAVNAEDPHAFQERFRVLRGTEMCRALTTDITSGRLSGSQPELPALGAAARELAGAVKAAAPKAAGGRRKKGAG